MCLLTRKIMPHIPFLFVSSDFCRLASLLPPVVLSASLRVSAYLAVNHLATCQCFGHDSAHEGLAPSGLVLKHSFKELLLYLPFKAHTTAAHNWGYVVPMKKYYNAKK